MSPSEALKQILKDKKERDAVAASAVDWESRRRERISTVADLYSTIEGWLTPSLAEGIVKLSREPCELHERHLGTFMSETLVLQVGDSTVRFRPVAASVAGASARVDVACGPRSITLVLLPGRSGWSLLVRAAGVQTLPLTEESFTDMLRDLLDE